MPLRRRPQLHARYLTTLARFGSVRTISQEWRPPFHSSESGVRSVPVRSLSTCGGDDDAVARLRCSSDQNYIHAKPTSGGIISELPACGVLDGGLDSRFVHGTLQVRTSIWCHRWPLGKVSAIGERRVLQSAVVTPYRGRQSVKSRRAERSCAGTLYI